MKIFREFSSVLYKFIVLYFLYAIASPSKEGVVVLFIALILGSIAAVHEQKI